MFLAGVAAGAFAEAQQQPAPGPRQDLTKLTLEELANVEIVSVQKRPEMLKDTPAAVTVITSEEIGGASATSIPALLRRVAGVHVARLNSSQWAIGIRGFTNGATRAQLALADGRSLYTPLFAGTYWDVQNVFLEDVDRIEVVRGPGGTLWGANAVTGVINIITKRAADTHGGYAVAGAGNVERGFGRARFGGSLSEKTDYRVYGMYFDRDPEAHDDGSDYDAWRIGQGGFRIDTARSPSETLTFQGDIYTGRAGRRGTFASFTAPFARTVEDDARLSGGNLRSRWDRSLSSEKVISIQGYYDRTNRTEANFSEARDTLDLDGQYRFRLSGRQEVAFGLGYRISDGRTKTIPTLGFVPSDKTDNLFNAFVEDTIRLVPDRLTLTLGTKVERNDYSGFEFQPSSRLSFSWSPRHGVWGAVTRPVRTPSRFDRDLVLNISASPTAPTFARLLGTDTFETERSLVFEAGYRGRLSRHVSVDLAGFHNRYPNLVSYEAAPRFQETGRTIIPLRTANGTEGTVSGVEVAADVRPSDHFLLRAAYSYLNMKLAPRPGSTDTGSSGAEDTSPRHQIALTTSVSLPANVSLDAGFRWVARLPTQVVHEYAELDARVTWRPLQRLDLAFAGENLLHSNHVEFGVGALGGRGTSFVRIRRSVYVQAGLRW